MEKKRSVGITIVGWLLIILGAWSLLFGLFTDVPYILEEIGKFRQLKETGFIETEPPLLNLIFETLQMWVYLGLTYLILGIGLLKLKNWARILTIIITLLQSLLFTSVAVKEWFFSKTWKVGGMGSMFYIPLILGISLLAIISILVGGLFIFFFTRPKVKEQFK